MDTTLITVIALAFVVVVVAVAAYALFELTPFARHAESFRDARTGKRLRESPHLETWTEFEQRTHDDLN